MGLFLGRYVLLIVETLAGGFCTGDEATARRVCDVFRYGVAMKLLHAVVSLLGEARRFESSDLVPIFQKSARRCQERSPALGQMAYGPTAIGHPRAELEESSLKHVVADSRRAFACLT